MNSSKLNADEIMFQSGLRINNSMNDAQVLDAVSAFGYTTEKLTEGAKLLAEATVLVETQKKEYGEVDAAQAAFETKRADAHRLYMNMLAICQVAFKKNVQAISTLDLTGRRATTISGWLKQTAGFYRALLANAGWKAVLASYGQTEEKLQAQLAAIEEVAVTSETKKKEMGDAQNATKLRDEKLEELADWVNDYEVIAEIALAGSPQLLEKLGIVVKS